MLYDFFVIRGLRDLTFRVVSRHSTHSAAIRALYRAGEGCMIAHRTPMVTRVDVGARVIGSTGTGSSGRFYVTAIVDD